MVRSPFKVTSGVYLLIACRVYTCWPFPVCCVRGRVLCGHMSPCPRVDWKGQSPALGVDRSWDYSKSITSKAEVLPKERGKKCLEPIVILILTRRASEKIYNMDSKKFHWWKHVVLDIWFLKIILNYIYRNILMHVRIRLNSILLSQFKHNSFNL